MHRFFPLVVCLLCAWTSLADENARFEFRDGRSKTFVVEPDDQTGIGAKVANIKSFRVRSEQHPDQVFDLTDKVAVQIKPGSNLNDALRGSRLELLQQVNDTTFIFQAPDAQTAAREAARLARNQNVLNSSPVMRSLNVGLQAPQAARPNDPLFSSLWHLENQTYPGVDLNARGGWLLSLGESVTMAIADQAIDVSHSELSSRANSTLHFNFVNDSTDLTLTDKDNHATGVAGLAVATMNNAIGIAGLAPESSFASWRIFSTNGAVTDDQQLMNMFQYRSNSVAVQNHSWASTTRSLYSIGFLSRIGIDNAVHNGRNGKGIVLVRSAGNRRLGGFEGGAYRELSGNANDDGFAADPNVIVVAAARANGRVTRYSSPGANILVAGLSSESPKDDTTAIATGYPALTTTARGGGYANFSGTSAAVPQISGIVSLILSVNTNLTYRDVQQILLLSSRHFDLADPDLRTNGAGLQVSHNLGFGIPDALTAVYLAKKWNNRPARTQLNFLQEEEKIIPDQGFIVRATGSDVPGGLFTISALMPREERHPDFAPGEMFRPDSPTAELPAVYVGQATAPIAQDLSGKVALIQRGGGATFYEKVKRAEQAGATAAVVFNNAGDDLILMNMTNFVSIPCTFIGQTAGDALVAQSQTNSELRVQLGLNTATYTFDVSDQLSLEHVGVKVRTDNLRRSDIRVTLTAPSGTRSILQRFNNDPSTNAPIDWTYISTQHFYESSVGTWTVQFSDELAGATGLVTSVELQLFGVPITDSDADGLDDGLEMAKFGDLNANPSDDPDNDNLSNLIELLLNSNPLASDLPVITAQPPHRVSNVGGTVTFDVEASGMQPLLYQWKHNGTNLVGATQSELTINNIQNWQQGNYSVEVSNLAGSVISSNAQLGLFTCTFQTAISETNFSLEGGSGSITVTTSNGCSWAATTTNDWITITSGSSGNGNGAVFFSLFENLEANRTGSIVVGGKTHIVSQEGANLPGSIAGRTFTLIPASSSGLSQRLLLIVAHDGSGVRLFEVNGTNTIESGNFTYTQQPGGIARITFGGTQLDLAFAAGASGTFDAINLNGNSYEGTFAMIENGPDFNGDGRVDLLIRTEYRTLVAWIMNGTNFIRNGAIRNGIAVGTDWRAAGIADFNGDGKADILFQDSIGRHAVWSMDGTDFIGSYFLRNATSVGVGWASVGIADFNGDGSKDILFQREDGALAVWLLNGTNFIKSAWLRDGLPATGWRCFGTGDFNGDGKPDVVFLQPSTGRLAVWYFDGTTFLKGDLLRGGVSVNPVWRPAAVADLNNDGKPDILFQNNVTGVIAVWLMDGKDFVSSVLLRNGQPVGAGGRLIAPR